MGDTCSACQANSNQQEIKTVTLSENKENIPEAAPTTGREDKVASQEDGMKKSKESAGSGKKPSVKEDTLKISHNKV